MEVPTSKIKCEKCGAEFMVHAPVISIFAKENITAYLITGGGIQRRSVRCTTRYSSRLREGSAIIHEWLRS
jgi:hypothetical protein